MKSETSPGIVGFQPDTATTSVFPRQQSRKFQALEMEKLELPEPWSRSILNTVGLIAFLATVVYLTGVLQWK